MGFGEAIQSGFRNYVGFSGRASRSEYWYWVLFAFLVGIAASIADASLGGGMSTVGILGGIVGLALLLPNIAIAIRRLHDRDKSGWWLLLVLIPLIGAIILIVWFVVRGTSGPNRFGPDPLQAQP
jgi:uncharacterized membrane protein YhaH (DUF805 family)